MKKQAMAGRCSMALTVVGIIDGLLAVTAVLRAALTRAGTSAFWPEAAAGAGATILLLHLDRYARRKESRREEQSLLCRASFGVAAVADPAHPRLLHANPGFYRLFDYENAEEFDAAFGPNLLQAVYSHDREAFAAQLRAHARREDRLCASFRVTDQTGRKHWLDMEAFYSHGDGATPVYLCVLRDVTEYQQSLLQLETELERHRIISALSDDILFDYDLETKAFTSTRPFTDCTSFSRQISPFQDTCLAHSVIYDEDIPAFQAFCREMDNQMEKVRAELRVCAAQNRYVWYRFEGARLDDRHGRPLKVIGRLVNIDRQKRETEYLTQKLERDPMTGVLNKVAAERRIERCLHKQAGGACLGAFCIIDIDNFKYINDTRGHLFGDRVITHIAQGVRGTLSETDVFGRIGGDEFVIYFDRVHSVEEVQAKAESLHALFGKLKFEDGGDFSLSGSIGIALAPDDGASYRELFLKADHALYEAKAHGKDGYAFYRRASDRQEEPSGEPLRDAYARRRSRAPFDQQVLDNTLNLLNRQDAVHTATQVVMAYIGRYYHAKRFYILEFSGKKQMVTHIHGWAEHGYELDKAALLSRDGDFWNRHIQSFGGINVFQNVAEGAAYRPLDGSHEIRGSLQHAIMRSGSMFTLAVLEFRSASNAFSDFAVNTFTVLHKLLQHHISLLENMHVYEHMANMDALTEALTYESFHTVVKTVVGQNPQLHFVLISMDFNRFAEINDLIGHEKADRVLITLANVLQRDLGEHEAVCRVTSDIFLVLAVFTDKPALDARLAAWDRELQRKIAAFHLPNGAPLAVGVCEIGSAEEGLSSLFDKSNKARKLGKGQRRSVFHYYDKALHAQAMYEQELENSMHASLQAHDFLLYLQPKYRLNDRAIAGAEALVRWQHPTRGLIQPADFIPLFEKNHFVIDLDFYMLEEVCKMLRGWLDEGRAAVPIAVNFSRVHLTANDFVPRLVSIVRQYGIDPKWIEVELTESAFVRRTSDTFGVIDRLRQTGFAIAMDDFGSGYSSFNSLKYLPIDVLKLDKNFFREKEPTPKEIIIIENLVRLAKQLELRVVSEGVEYEWQAELLCSLDCDLAQGYLFSRPVSVSAFERLMNGAV